jgi:hypothetical protein
MLSPVVLVSTEDQRRTRKRAFVLTTSTRQERKTIASSILFVFNNRSSQSKSLSCRRSSRYQGDEMRWFTFGSLFKMRYDSSDYADAVVLGFGRQGKPENTNLIVGDLLRGCLFTTSTFECNNDEETRQKTRKHRVNV